MFLHLISFRIITYKFSQVFICLIHGDIFGEINIFKTLCWLFCRVWKERNRVVLEILLLVTWTDIEPACKWRLTFILWNVHQSSSLFFSSVQKSKYLPLKIIDVVLVGFRINKQFRACIRLSYFQLPISILHEDHWSVKLKYIYNFEGGDDMMRVCQVNRDLLDIDPYEIHKTMIEGTNYTSWTLKHNIRWFMRL